MSIWGKRVDGWVNGKTGGASRSDYNRSGLNALWQVALVLLAAVIVWLIAQEL